MMNLKQLFEHMQDIQSANPQQSIIDLPIYDSSGDEIKDVYLLSDEKVGFYIELSSMRETDREHV